MDTESKSEPDFEFSKESDEIALTFLILAICIFWVIGLVGNSLIICVILWFRKMRTMSNFYLAVLALSDIIVLSMSIPHSFILYVFSNFYILEEAIYFISAFGLQLSSVSLVVIAADRYF